MPITPKATNNSVKVKALFVFFSLQNSKIIYLDELITYHINYNVRDTKTHTKHE